MVAVGGQTTSGPSVSSTLISCWNSSVSLVHQSTNVQSLKILNVPSHTSMTWPFDVVKRLSQISALGAPVSFGSGYQFPFKSQFPPSQANAGCSIPSKFGGMVISSIDDRTTSIVSWHVTVFPLG